MEINNSQYHDFKALSELRRKAEHSTEEAIEPVARQFEAVFLQMMLKSMRDTVPEGGLFDNQSTKFYEDMMDSQLSVSLAEQGGIGLADMLTEQLSRMSPEVAGDQVSASAESMRSNLLQNRIKVFPAAADKL